MAVSKSNTVGPIEAGSEVGGSFAALAELAERLREDRTELDLRLATVTGLDQPNKLATIKIAGSDVDVQATYVGYLPTPGDVVLVFEDGEDRIIWGKPGSGGSGGTFYVVNDFPGATFRDQYVAANTAAHATGGVIVILPGSYSTTSLPAVTSPKVSIWGIGGSAATIITLTGSGGALFTWANNPLTVQQQGFLKGITINGASNITGIGVNCVDTGTLPAFEDLVIQDFTGGIGIQIENVQIWSERASGIRVHLNHNAIGMRLKGNGAVGNSFGYHRWLDLRLNLGNNQIGIQSTAGAYVYAGFWSVICNIDGSNSTIIQVVSGGWNLATMAFTGEQTTGSGSKSIHVMSGAYFNVHGQFDVFGTTIQNDNTAPAANNLTPPTLRVIPSHITGEDAGVRPSFAGGNNAKIIPWISPSADIAGIGRLAGTGIESVYVSFYDSPGNALVFLCVGFQESLQASNEVGRIDTSGVLQLLGGLKIYAAGPAPRVGAVALVGGTATVNTIAVTNDSRIFLTHQNLAGVADPKPLAVTGRVVGTSFTIRSSDAADTSVIGWEIVEPWG